MEKTSWIVDEADGPARSNSPHSNYMNVDQLVAVLASLCYGTCHELSKIVPSLVEELLLSKDIKIVVLELAAAHEPSIYVDCRADAFQNPRQPSVERTAARMQWIKEMEALKEEITKSKAEVSKIKSKDSRVQLELLAKLEQRYSEAVVLKLPYDRLNTRWRLWQLPKGSIVAHPPLPKYVAHKF